MDDKTLRSDALTLICPTCSARYAMPPYVEGQKYGCRKCGASLFFGKFAILQELGRGGFGVVYKAWQADLERIVALKFLHGDSDESTERFIREARIAANLNHPNITAIYEVGKHEGKLYITMQFVDGTPTNKMPMSPREAAEVVRDAAMAVDYAHARKVIHRDIKPHNLMVTLETSGTHPAGSARRVFVMDFGLARSTSKESSLTTEGQIMGTPAFMSPEQAEAKAADVRSDVYCLGATLYALATRRPPYEAPTPLQVLMMVAKGDLSPPSKANPAVDPDLESIIVKAMALDPADRYPTAARLAQDLARWLGGEVPDSGNTLNVAASRARRTSGGRRRSLALAFAAAVALAAAGLGVAAFAALRGSKPASQQAPAVESLALRLESHPSGAKVRRKNGPGEWVTPAEVMASALAGETHVLVFSKPGYLDREREVRLRPGRPELIFENLDPVPSAIAQPPEPRPVLDVRSDPAGARLRLAGRPGSWTTPAVLTDQEAPPGEYQLELSLPGYEPLLEQVQLTLDRRATVSRTLKKMQREVAFTLTSEPAGARVFLNGADTGAVTPLTIYRDQVSGLVAQVELRLDGFDSQRRTPDLKPEAYGVHVPMVPQTGAFVIHGAVPQATLRLFAIPREAKRPKALAGLWSESAEGLAQALAAVDAPDAAFATARLRELSRRPEPAIRDRAAALAAVAPASAGVVLEGTTTADALGNARFDAARITRRYYVLATSPQARDFVSDELQPLVQKEIVLRVEMTALASVRAAVRPPLGEFEVLLADGTVVGRLAPGGPAVRVPAAPLLLRYRPPAGDPLLRTFTVGRRPGEPDLAGNVYAFCGDAFEADGQPGLAARAWQKVLEEKAYPSSEEAARGRLPERIRRAYRAWVDGRPAAAVGTDGSRRLQEARGKTPSDAAAAELMDLALAPDLAGPARAEAAGLLAGMLARLGRPYEAMEWIERAARLGGDPGPEIEARVLSASRGRPGLEARGAEVAGSLEAMRRPIAPPPPPPSEGGPRVGTVQLADAQIGIWVNLEEKAQVAAGTPLEVVRDGEVVAELLAGATLPPDETYRHGALRCTRVKGPLPKKGDQVRHARK